MSGLSMYSIFPVGIGVSKNSNLYSESTKKEHEYCMSEVETYMHPQYAFETSTNTRLLTTDSNIRNITKFINKSLQEYSKTILQSNNKMKITQSWLSKHDEIPQVTYAHRHPNSVISGVYYIEADPKVHAGLTFSKDLGYGQTFIQHHADPELEDDSNPYAAQEQTVPADKGTLILFPSWLNHTVVGKQVAKPRCSIAFNTWFEDEIGNDKLFTQLGKVI